MINLCIIGGHCGADPEITDNGRTNKFARLRLCTTERGFTTKDGRVVSDRNTWHNVTLMGSLANFASYIHTGDMLVLRGKYHTREVETDGKRQTYYNFDAEEILLHYAKQTDATAADVQ